MIKGFPRSRSVLRWASYATARLSVCHVVSIPVGFAKSCAFSCRPSSSPLIARAGGNGKSYDYDLVIIGCGVGGHGAALHAVECVSFWPTI